MNQKKSDILEEEKAFRNLFIHSLLFGRIVFSFQIHLISGIWDMKRVKEIDQSLNKSFVKSK